MANASDYLTAPRSVELRRTMVDCQLRTFDVTDPRILSAVLATPREPFLKNEPDALVYSDASLAVRGASVRRRLMPPMFVARALQTADVGRNDRALDVGGGGGFSAAVLAHLCGSVIALEEDDAFVSQASQAFSELGLANAQAVKGELATGLPERGPFDLILVNGAIEVRPDALLAQLADGGRLLAVKIEPGATLGAGRFVMFERVGDVYGEREMFGAAADVLSPFARRPEFAF